MPPTSKTSSSTLKPFRDDRKLSEVARHVVVPTGIVSTGFPKVYARIREFGDEFDEWQVGASKLILAKRANGDYAATIGGVTLSIPRQVAKTYMVGRLVFALCTLFPNLTVLWSAHRTRTSSKTFSSLRGFASRRTVAPYVRAIRATNGEQEIHFHNGSVIMFGAREGGFGRGFEEVDIEVFDEAQILTEKALEDMVAATNQSRFPSGALLFFMGTPPRPVDPGEAFSLRRGEALEVAEAVAAGGSPEFDGVYIECSADEDADPDDRAQWARANPSYPNRTPLRSMLRLRKNLPSDDSWLREALGIWDAAGSPEVIDAASWSAIADPSSMAVERLTLAIDVAPDRRLAAVSLAGRRADGLWHVELDDQRKGVEWVSSWVKSRAEKNRLHAVVVDELSGLVEKRNGRNYLAGTDVQVTLAASEGRDMAIACGKFFDGVMESTPKLRHTDQPQLNVAVSVARKRPLPPAWAWNRKEATSDITPIVAATLALWGAQKDNVERPTRRTTNERTAVIL